VSREVTSYARQSHKSPYAYVARHQRMVQAGTVPITPRMDGDNITCGTAALLNVYNLLKP
jgi:hypothetical protein